MRRAGGDRRDGAPIMSGRFDLESHEADTLTWKDAPDTPAWAVELLEELEGGGGTTNIGVAHRQAEVLLTLRILREQPPDVWEEWAQSKHSPMWMRSAIVEYSVSGSRWEQVRHQADLELVEEMLGEMMESGAE